MLPSVIDNRYELGDLIGTGGAGAVYKAIDRHSGSEVALKLLHMPLVDATHRARFAREVDAYRRMAGVPGVVNVNDHGIVGDLGWLVMDLHDQTLSERLRSEGPLAAEEVRLIGARCARALSDLHAAGMVHRDIKPSNVLLDRDGGVYLGDLGVVSIEGESTLTGLTPLSLQWAAPEMIETGESSKAADIYGLGATLFTMLTGQPPFDLAGDGNAGGAVAVGPALRLIAAGSRAELDDHVPADLRSLVDEMMRTDPQARVLTAAAVAERLERQPTQSEDATSQTASVPLPPNTRRPRFAAGVVVIALALVIATMWWSGRGTDGTQAVVVSEATPIAPAATAQTSPSETESVQESAPPTALPIATAAPVQAAPVQAAPTADVVEAPTPEVESTCRSLALWCEPLAIEGFQPSGDTDLVTYEEVTSDFGPALRFVPGNRMESGAFSLDRSLAGIGQTNMIAVRFRLRADQLEADVGEWWQQVVTLSDERGRFWSVNLTATQDGELRFNTGFFAPPDFSGGSGAVSTVAAGAWHCVELLLDQEMSGTPVELRVNGATVATLPDQEARQRGVGILLSIGPRWIESAATAPDLTIAELEIGATPLGCD